MAHNGGNPNPPPPLRQAPTVVHGARLLPRHAAVNAPSSSPHRSRQPPPPTSSSAVGESRNFITLDQPRPGVARVINEYIETPLRTQLSPSTPTLTHPKKVGGCTTTKSDHLFDDLSRTSSSSTGSPAGGVNNNELNYNQNHYHHHQHHNNTSHYHPNHHHNHHRLNHLLLQPGPLHPDGRPPTLQSPSTQRLNFSSSSSSSTSSSSGLHHLHQLQNTQALGAGKATAAIVNQPSSTTLKRSDVDEVTLGEYSKDDGHRESIICPECSRCRCGACRSSRPLPSTWICSDTYQCSAETTLDYCTCMCCVKAAFYHCCKDYDESDSGDVSCADKPCSCAPHRRCLRWGCLCFMTALLPCLLCYLPMKGCVRVCEVCHNRFTTRQGCKCPSSTQPPTSNSSRLTFSPSPVASDNDDDNSTYRRKSVFDVPLKAQHSSKRLLEPNIN